MGSVILDSFNGVPLGAPLTLVTADGSFTTQTVATPYGPLSVNGFTPVTGADGSVIAGRYSYRSTLTANRADHHDAGQDGGPDNPRVDVATAAREGAHRAT